MTRLPYPRHKTVAYIWAKLQKAVATLETSTFPSLDAALHFDGIIAMQGSAFHDLPPALMELEQDGKVRSFPDGRVEVLDLSFLPPQQVVTPLPTPLARLRDRYRTSLEAMTPAYVQVFLMETGLRAVIAHVLSGVEPQWWLKRVPSTVQANAEGNFKSDLKKVRYRLPDEWARLSDVQRLDFIDFSRLPDIIIDPLNWPLFEKTLRIDYGLAGRLKELEPLRNAVAHMRPLSQDDLDVLRVHSIQVAGVVDLLA